VSDGVEAPTPATRAQPTVLSLIDELSARLAESRGEDARQVSRDIIAALLEVPRSWTAINRDTLVDISIAHAARNAAARLTRGAPFAYAVGSACFRHLNLAVDERVLIPRPETEVLVTEILDRTEARFGAQDKWGTAVDIGTGSGAIALSLASEGNFDRVIATDASLDALGVARGNLTRSAGVVCTGVELRHGSLLSPLKGVSATVLVSNPPYIAFSEIEALDPSVRNWEPPLALFSGHDGMAATAEIVRNGWRNLVNGGLLALEVDERRASLVAEMVMRHGSYGDVGVRLDLAGRERFVLATRI